MSQQKAVIDRIEDKKHAVLLVGDDEREHVVPVSTIPSGATEGDVLSVRFKNGKLLEATIDRDATNAAEKRVQSKKDKLKKRGRRL